MKTISLKDLIITALLLVFIFLFFYGLNGAIVPLLFSWLLAYAAIPLVKKIEKRGLSRAQASFAVLAITFITFLLMSLLIVPPLFSELQAAIQEVPRNISIVLEKMDGFLSNYGFHVPYERQSLIDFASHYTQKVSASMITSIGEFLKNSVVNAASIIVIFLNLFLVPIFFIYVINDYENLIQSIESLVPASWRPRLDVYLSEANIILSGYIRGQLLVCCILGVLYSVGLFIVGIKFSLILGFFTGFLSIIPYVGFSFGLVAALITALANFDGVGSLAGIGVVYGLVQALESFIITPRIVGNSVGLTPFEAILALIILGNLLGFVGLFLAIPVGALSKMMLCHLFEEYKKTSFYKM